MHHLRINSPTMALLDHEGRRVAHTIPAGAVIETDTGVFDDNSLVEVLWDEKRVMMFTQDLRSRGEPIEG